MVGLFAKARNEMLERSTARVGDLSVKGRYHHGSRVLEDDYVIDYDEALGEGCSGNVFLARALRTGVTFAVKSFDLEKMSHQRQKDVTGEVEIFLSMDHPHVVRLMDVYDTGKALKFVMEHMAGGELYSHLSELGRFPEQEAAQATLYMLRAVHYLHSEGVVHRDLKMENFMYEQKHSDDPSHFIKLNDFGFSKFFKEGEKMQDSLGTVLYVAPEVISRKYSGGSCDMWSLGVIVFTLLSGSMPFLGKTQNAVLRAIRRGKVLMTSSNWANVSEHGKDFVQKLLVVKPSERMTASQALSHPWLMAVETPPDPALDASVVRAFVQFSKLTGWKQTCLKMMAWTLSGEARRELRESFINSTLSRSGLLKVSALHSSILQRPDIAPEEKIELCEVLKCIDTDTGGTLHYSDFLAAMMAEDPELHDAALYRTFWHFAQDSRGDEITPVSFKEMIGNYVDEEEVDRFFKIADTNKDGKIEAEEFVNALCLGPKEKTIKNVQMQLRQRTLALEASRSSYNSRCSQCSGLCRWWSDLRGGPGK